MTQNPVAGQPIPNYTDLIAKSHIGKSEVSAPSVQSPGNFYYSGDQFELPEGALLTFIDPFQFISLLNAFKPWRRPFRVKPFTVGLTPLELLPLDELRTYLLIVNTSGNTLFLGFDSEPSAANGLPIAANGGSYEPLVVPTNGLYVLGSAAPTTMLCIYAT